MEIRKAEEIIEQGTKIRPQLSKNNYFNTYWVDVDSLLDMIYEESENGNIILNDNKKGFSASILLSRLIDELEHPERTIHIHENKKSESIRQ